VPRSDTDYLRWKLGRWAKEFAPNIRMLDESFRADFRLDPSERAIAQISLASGGLSIIVTDLRLVQDGRTLLRYDELRYCIWIHREQAMKAKLKQSHFQRMILERTDNSELLLDGLGQAVFPLLKFFWFKRGCGEPRAT
jgi:hypothetical protein